MVEVGYSDYVALGYKGGEEEFSAALPSARAIVDRIVGPNAVEGREEAYRSAVCAAAAEVAGSGRGGSPSVSLGSFSIGAVEPGEAASAAGAAALDILVPAGLAFGGCA